MKRLLALVVFVTLASPLVRAQNLRVDTTPTSQAKSYSAFDIVNGKLVIVKNKVHDFDPGSGQHVSTPKYHSFSGYKEHASNPSAESTSADPRISSIDNNKSEFGARVSKSTNGGYELWSDADRTSVLSESGNEWVKQAGSTGWQVARSFIAGSNNLPARQRKLRVTEEAQRTKENTAELKERSAALRKRAAGFKHAQQVYIERILQPSTDATIATLPDLQMSFQSNLRRIRSEQTLERAPFRGGKDSDPVFVGASRRVQEIQAKVVDLAGQPIAQWHQLRSLWRVAMSESVHVGVDESLAIKHAFTEHFSPNGLLKFGILDLEAALLAQKIGGLLQPTENASLDLQAFEIVNDSLAAFLTNRRESIQSIAYALASNRAFHDGESRLSREILEHCQQKRQMNPSTLVQGVVDGVRPVRYFAIATKDVFDAARPNVGTYSETDPCDLECAASGAAMILRDDALFNLLRSIPAKDQMRCVIAMAQMPSALHKGTLRARDFVEFVRYDPILSEELSSVYTNWSPTSHADIDKLLRNKDTLSIIDVLDSLPRSANVFDERGIVAAPIVGDEASQLAQAFGKRLRTDLNSMEGKRVRFLSNRLLVAYATSDVADTREHALGGLALAIAMDASYSANRADIASAMWKPLWTATDFVLGFVPLAGTVNDAIQIVHGMATGFDYTDKRMEEADYLLRAFGVVSGLVPKAAIRFGGQVLSKAFAAGCELVRRAGLREFLRSSIQRTELAVRPIVETLGRKFASATEKQLKRAINEVVDKHKSVLRKVGGNAWVSSAGLRYELYARRGGDLDHRILHLLNHTEDLPLRAGQHGVFARDSNVFELIDEAWRVVKGKGRVGGRAVLRKEGTTSVWEVEMKREVGFVGGTWGAANGTPATKHIRLVIKGENELVTAYPFIPE